MLPSQIDLFLIFFDLCGFNSGTSRLFYTEKPIHFVRIVHLLLAILVGISLFLFYYRFLLTFKFMDTVNELVEALGSIFTYCLIILDAQFKHRTNKHFYEISEICNRNQLNITFGSYIAKMVVFFVMTVLATAIRSYLYNFWDLISVLGYLTLVKICQIRVLYYLFCLEVIHFQLENIEQELKIMKKVLRDVNSEIHSLDSFVAHRFKRIRSYFHCVYNMANDLNETFGWSQVAIIQFCFFCLFTDVNYFSANVYMMSYVKMFGKLLLTISLKLITNELVCLLASCLWVMNPPLLILSLLWSMTEHSRLVCLFK